MENIPERVYSAVERQKGLEEASEWPQAVHIAELLQNNGFEAVVVGGAVRDMILGHPPKDFDLATSASSSQIEELFALSVTPDTSSTYGVTRVRIPLLNSESEYVEVEVATFRTDEDTSAGRKGTIVNTENVSLEEDQQRRDFTINNLALDPVTGQLIGDISGIEDLDNKVIRFVGEPSERIQEDPLRIIRAIRFKNRFGFSYEDGTATAVKRGVEMGKLLDIPAERLQKELTAILRTAESRRTAIEDLDSFGILDILLPEVTAGKEVEQGTKHHAEGDVWEHQLRIMEALPKDASDELMWAALLHDIGKPYTQEKPNPDEDHFTFYGHPEEGVELARKVLNRLKFSNTQKDTILWLIEEHINIIGLADPQMSKGKKKKMMNHPAFSELLQLHEADKLASLQRDKSGELVPHDDAGIQEIHRLWALHQLLPPEVQKPDIKNNPEVNIGGKDIIDLINQIAPGYLKTPRNKKLIGEVNTYLQELFGDDHSLTRDQLLDLARVYISEHIK